MSGSIRGALAHAAFALALQGIAAAAQAGTPSMGGMQLPQVDGGKTTLFYPTAAAESQVRRGVFTLSIAAGAPPAAGNGRLVVISHGSGGSPWVHTDLARALVGQGFTVALPQHHRDNYQDPSDPGPPSFSRRPREVSAVIDLVRSYAPLARHLSLDKVGVFGGSAGGHTALALAGGAWSEQGFRRHCDRHIAEDFAACAGLLTRLDGNWLDGVKTRVTRWVVAARFSDATIQRHADPRVAAAVAMVPAAADFDPASLRHPRIPLGLVIAEQDIFLKPKFHAEAVLRACAPACEVVMRLPDAGHGAMLAPLPPLSPGATETRLLADPPAFRRDQAIPELNGRIARFFRRHLLGGAARG